MNLNIAGAFTFDKKKLLIIFTKLKLLKKFNVKVYDGPNNCKWNGGRINRNINIDLSDIEFYNKFKIPVSFTFSNGVIDLKDNVGLELLELLDQSSKKYKIQNEITLINEELRLFLKDNYNFNLKYSITGHDLEAYPNSLTQQKYFEYYSNLETKYDLIVPKMEHIFQDWFLKLNLEKYEIMVNDTCKPNCEFYYEHFKEISKVNSNGLNSKDIVLKIKEVEECWLSNFNPDNCLTSCKTGMDLDNKLITKAKSLGYINFKISGRENKLNELEHDISKFNEIK